MSSIERSDFNEVQLTLTITRRRRSASSLARSPSSFSNGSVTVTYVGCPFGGNSHCRKKNKTSNFFNHQNNKL